MEPTTTRTVPAYLAELAAGEDAARLRPHGRQLGARVEVDLASVATTDAELAERIVRYLDQVARFRRQRRGDYLAVQVPLLNVTQQDNRSGRVDLADQLDALEGSVLAPLVEVALSADVDITALETLGAPHQLVWHRGPDQRSVYQMTVTGVTDWDRALGGAAGPDEVARQLTITASHAAWRDRRVRRLVAVDVAAIVVVPTPA
jgi:hypothetical protein